MKVSIVIPTKNEEGNIKDILGKVKNFGDEVLVIDGHSKDKTREIAGEQGIRVVQDGGKGKGDGVRSGIQQAVHDILVFIDADGSHDPEDIPKLVGPIKKGEADLVIASRRTGGSDELYGDFNKFLRETGSQLINLLINHKFKVHLTDSQNGFRAIKKEVAQKLDLKEDITTIEQEMLIKALKRGYVVKEVSSHEYERRFGHSVIKLSKVWWQYIFSCLKYLYFD